MPTKQSWWDIRRRTHGEHLEKLVIRELIHDGVLEPIASWNGFVRPLKNDQPFFLSKNGSSECRLDEFGWVRNDTGDEMRSCIVEVKAMRMIDWIDWEHRDLLHLDKLNQRLRHLKICAEYAFDGVAFIALNKDTDELSIRTFDVNDGQIFRYIC